MSRVLLAALMLAACDSAGPAVWGGAVAEVTVGPSRFRVYTSPDRALAEIHRISVEAPASLRQLPGRAARAAELATGCRIRPGTLTGDPALMQAELDC